MYTVQDPPGDPPSDILLLSPLKCLFKSNVRIQELPQAGDSRPGLCHRLNTPCQMMRNWEIWNKNLTLKSLTTTGCSNN